MYSMQGTDDGASMPCFSGFLGVPGSIQHARLCGPLGLYSRANWVAALHNGMSIVQVPCVCVWWWWWGR